MSLLLANAGTPLIWFTACHLILINAIIGLVEAWMMRRVFGGTRRSAPLILIAANYLSAFAPVLVHALYADQLNGWLDRNITIESVFAFHLVGLAAILLVTLLLEFPFVCLAMSNPRDIGRAIKANLLIQPATFAAMFVPYLLLSPFMLTPVGPVQMVPLSAIDVPKDWWVYFVPPSERSVWRIRLDGGNAQRVAEIPSPDEVESLFTRREAPDEPWRLFYRTTHFATHKPVPWHGEFATTMPTIPAPISGGSLADLRAQPHQPYFCLVDDDVYEVPNLSGYVGTVGDYRLNEFGQDALGVNAGWWPSDGIVIRPRGEQLTRYALDSPLIPWWAARQPWVLPDEKIVYQLGRQIVVLDVHAKRLALLTRGEHPIVVPEADLIQEPSVRSVESATAP